MKNLDVTLAQIPLVAVGLFYIYLAADWLMHPSGEPKAFVYVMTIGIVLLGIALGLQEIRNFRAKKENLNLLKREYPIPQKDAITQEVTMIPCEFCRALMPQTSTFCPNCGARRKG